LNAFERLGGPAARRSADRFWMSDTFDPGSDYMTVCMPLYSRRLDESAFAELTARTVWNVDMLTHYIGPVVRSVDFRPDLGKIACPTLILTGDDDPVMPFEGAEELAAGIDPALVRLERFENCGHGVFHEDPEKAFTILRNFIDEMQKAPARG
jgi:proline iminopeptidase